MSYSTSTNGIVHDRHISGVLPFGGPTHPWTGAQARSNGRVQNSAMMQQLGLITN